MTVLGPPPALAAPNLSPPPRPPAVVIGAGLGGLAAAVRLGARGYRVTVLERLDAPGGRARAHRQDGFTFDAGPTIITAPFLLDDLWALAGRRREDDVELRPLSPFYRIRFDGGDVFEVSGDAAAMRAQVARFGAPGDLDGHARFLRVSEAACRVGFERLGHKPFGSVMDMARCAPDLLRLGAWRSVHGLVSSFLRDPRLRVVYGFHPLLIGGSPLRAPALYALIPHLEARWGVHWAVGGTGRIVEGLVGLVERTGGEVRLGAGVEAITVRDGRATGVRLAGSGREVRAPVVVSNADSAATLSRLLPPEARRPARWAGPLMRRARHSMGLFVWYFGTRRRFPSVGHHTVVLGPRYEGLLRDIFDRKALPEDFSLYLHRPTATDDSVAPPGCDAFYALSPVPNLDGATDWRAEAEPFRRRVLRRLAETVMPGFSDADVVSSRVATPLDFRDDLLAERGSGFGLEPVLTQSAWFRPHNRVGGGARGLYLVGAGTHPGAGVPGVLSSARVLDEVVPDARAFA